MECFELTNEQRKYFGLNPIEETWERVQWLTTSYIFFDGDVIRKIIHYAPHPNFHTGYIERDYDLQTHNREFIKPKTDKGKPKKVTASNILALKSSNVSFDWTCESVLVEFQANSITIAESLPEERITSFEQLEKWVNDYLAAVPENHFEQLHLKKEALKPKKNISYREGDIFYYQIEKNKFCFGQVLLDLRKITGRGKFTEEKILTRIGRFGFLGNALIVRGFNLISDSHAPDLETILRSGSSGGFYSIDYMIYNNICPIIGNCRVEEKDMVFPMALCAEQNDGAFLIFQWGFIEKRVALAPLKRLIEKTNYTVVDAGNITYHAAIVTPEEGGAYMETDMNHPRNSKLKDGVFKILNIPPGITYNQCAKEENELPVEQIIYSSSDMA